MDVAGWRRGLWVVDSIVSGGEGWTWNEGVVKADWLC